MKYIDVSWRHDEPLEPVRLVSELDDARNELRKLEIFRNGSAGYASGNRSSQGVELSIEPIPSLEEINKDPQFKGVSLTAQSFETLWQHHVGRDA